MFDKMSEEEIVDYNKALESIQEQQTQRRKAVEKGNIVKKEYLEKLETLKQTDKKMFVLFTVSGCPSCTVIKYIAKYEEKFTEAISNMEYILIDVGSTKVDLVDKYQIYSYPQYLIIDKDEKVLAKNTGCDAFNPVLNLVTWVKMFND